MYSYKCNKAFRVQNDLLNVSLWHWPDYLLTFTLMIDWVVSDGKVFRFRYGISWATGKNAGPRLLLHTRKDQETSQERYLAFFSSDRGKKNAWFILTSKQASKILRAVNILERKVEDEDGSKCSPKRWKCCPPYEQLGSRFMWNYIWKLGIIESFDEDKPSWKRLCET